MGRISNLLSTRKAILLSACLLIVSLAVTVYALVLTQAQMVDVQVQTHLPGVDVKIYSDSACTNEVTSISQNLGQGATGYTLLFIKNHGEGAYRLYWHSDVSVVSDKIYDSWFTNNTNIGPDQVIVEFYYIRVPADTPLATYSWTLTLYVGGL